MSAPVESTAPATTAPTAGDAPAAVNGVSETPATTAPATTTAGTNGATTSHPTGRHEPVDNRDVEHWTGRINEVLKSSGKSEAAVAEARSWHESLFACFMPVDTCLITCCLPCVTFGKTHHRLHHSGKLEGYNFINTSCIGFCLSSCLAFIPAALQRGDIRKKYKLDGDFATDLVITCCCGCCSLVQMSKEAEHQEKELLNNPSAQYSNAGDASMEYKAPVTA